MTLGFLSGSKNFCKLLWVSWEVFVLHGYDWIHWVAKSCTSNAYRWLFRDSQLSLRTLWSAVFKVTKFFSTRYGSAIASSAWGPCNFGPLTDLAISVSSEVSFNTVFTQKNTLLVDVGSKDSSWEELACESLCSGTLSSTRFSLFSCSHPGMSEHNGSPRSISWFPFFIWFGIFVWLGQQVFPFLPFDTFTWHSCGIGIYPTRVSPILSSHTVAWHSWRCHGWWGRRAWGRHRMINFLPWRCHGCRRRQAWGRTRW